MFVKPQINPYTVYGNYTQVLPPAQSPASVFIPAYSPVNLYFANWSVVHFYPKSLKSENRLIQIQSRTSSSYKLSSLRVKMMKWYFWGKYMNIYNVDNWNFGISWAFCNLNSFSREMPQFHGFGGNEQPSNKTNSSMTFYLNSLLFRRLLTFQQNLVP